jgi:hypothetical protein
MSSYTRSLQFVGILAAATLAACGGGGGGTVAGIDGTGITPQNPPSTAVAFGTVTAFGSVFVNGVRYDTSAASFTLDGISGTQADLGIGDVVLVTGSFAAGSTTQATATSVVYDDAVEGRIESIDLGTSTLVVLGQSVRITVDTSFDDSIQPASIDGLAGVPIIEVSGLIASDGSIEASRIEPKPVSGEFETTGLVSSIDSAAMRFSINALVVDYSGVSQLQDFPGGIISNGDLVEVKGGTTLGANGELIATRVEFKGGNISASAGDRVEVEGFITRFIDATDFDVSGQPVTTNSQTTIVGGEAVDLGLDIKVEAEGELDANGILVATKIDIRRARAVRVAALVDSVNGSSFVTLGITINSDSLTRIEDKSGLDEEPFAVSNLVVGDYVEVRGTEFPAGSGQLLAGRIEREDSGSTELQGFVTAVNEPDLSILGVTIMTGAGTIFRDANDMAILADDFFALVVAAGGGSAGSLVKATGQEVAPQMIAASQLEFEIE